VNLELAESLTYQLMSQHGLFLENWSFRWDNAKTRCGQCLTHQRVIQLSKSFVELNPEAEVKDTILHEIAHALVGPGHCHDRVWRLKAIEVGARPERCVSDKVALAPGKWVGVCIGCNLEIPRHRKPKYVGIPGFYSHTACKRAGRPAKIEWRKA
jgi:predicted SprT family Zn-dependent metalloprotease